MCMETDVERAALCHLRADYGRLVARCRDTHADALSHDGGLHVSDDAHCAAGQDVRAAVQLDRTRDLELKLPRRRRGRRCGRRLRDGIVRKRRHRSGERDRGAQGTSKRRPSHQLRVRDRPGRVTHAVRTRTAVMPATAQLPSLSLPKAIMLLSEWRTTPGRIEPVASYAPQSANPSAMRSGAPPPPRGAVVPAHNDP